MTTASAGQATATQSVDDLTPQERRRIIIGTTLRASATAAVLVILYFVLPLNTSGDAGSLLVLAVGLLVSAVIVLLRVREITQSNRPGLRAIETLSTVVPLYILLFATGYYLADRANPSNFTQPMDRAGALYFSMTVVSTVGFGDITAKTDAARMVVTTQMFFDLVLVAIGAKVILGAVQLGKERRTHRSTETATNANN